MSKQKGDRAQEAVKLAPAGRIKKARVARDHGKNRNADGSLHSTPNPHGPTSGAK